MFCLILSFKTCFKSNFLLKKIKTKKKTNKQNTRPEYISYNGKDFWCIRHFPNIWIIEQKLCHSTKRFEIILNK